MRPGRDLAALRAAFWGERALRQIRRQLREGKLEHLHVTPAPRVPREAGLGLTGVLRRRKPTCLEEALLLQRWKLGQHEPADVIIGVRAGEEFGAHAWIDGDTNVEGDFEELFRVSPP